MSYDFFPRNGARTRFRHDRPRRRLRTVVFAPGWAVVRAPAGEPEDRAEIDARRPNELRVAFAPGWPSPADLADR